MPNDDLYANLTRYESIYQAWIRVKKNKGVSGGDNVTIDRFETKLEARLTRILETLLTGEYQPGPVRIVTLKKKSGGERILRVPTIRDRVVLTAMYLELLPILEPEFEEYSHAYRPKRGVRTAIKQVMDFHQAGFDWVLDTDIDSFFDVIHHDKLIDMLKSHIGDGPFLELVKMFLAAFHSNGVGLAQGSPLSPILANIYLDGFDEKFNQRGIKLVRYADDFVLLAKNRSGIEAALDQVHHVLKEIGLQLKPEKTQIVPFDKGFDFLGHRFFKHLVEPSYDQEAEVLQRPDKALEDQHVVATTKADASDKDTRYGARMEPAFRTLYLHSRDLRLDVKHSAFSIQMASGLKENLSWNELFAVPIQDVGRIEIYPAVEVTTRAMRMAAAEDVIVAFVDGHGQCEGLIVNELGDRAKRHMCQIESILDEGKRLSLSKVFVDARVRNQRALLMRLNRSRKDKEIDAVLERTKRIPRAISTAADVPAVMGWEGYSTSQFWTAWSRCLPSEFKFKKRVRKGELDSVNIMLNFVAGLLMRDVRVAIQRADLHSGFGILHSVADGKEALVYDLMEEFRAPLLESVVAYAVNNHFIKRSDFEVTNHGTRMMPHAAKKLIEVYEEAVQRIVSNPKGNGKGHWRRMMVFQAFALARYFEEDVDYSPMIMKF